MFVSSGVIFALGIAIPGLGFIVAITTWLLEKKIEKLRDELVELKVEIANLKGRSGK